MPSPGPTIPVPLQGHSDRRQAGRIAAAMPVRVDGHEATTRDLSATGLSFVSDRPCTPGGRVEVIVEYLLDGHHYPLRCEAEVLRVEAEAGRWRVGARLVPQSQLVDVQVPPADSGQE